MTLGTVADGEKNYEGKKNNTNVTLGTDVDGEKNERTIVTNHNYTCNQTFNATFFTLMYSL